MNDQIKDVEFHKELISQLELRRTTLTALFYEIKMLEYFLDDVEAGKTRDEIKKARGSNLLLDIDPFAHILKW